MGQYANPHVLHRDDVRAGGPSTTAVCCPGVDCYQPGIVVWEHYTNCKSATDEKDGKSPIDCCECLEVFAGHLGFGSQDGNVFGPNNHEAGSEEAC
jgi:hypothetical protein